MSYPVAKDSSRSRTNRSRLGLVIAVVALILLAFYYLRYSSSLERNPIIGYVVAVNANEVQVKEINNLSDRSFKIDSQTELYELDQDNQFTYVMPEFQVGDFVNIINLDNSTKPATIRQARSIPVELSTQENSNE